MSVDTSRMMNSLQMLPSSPQLAGEDRFAERRRIALLEPDRALRSVLVRSLLRLGCIVLFKHDVEQVLCALRDGSVHGVVIALGVDAQQQAALQAANINQASIVVLSNTPHYAERADTLRYLQKPFDMRELLTLLHLPQKANILKAE